jgi:hypothetical protein
MPTRHLDRYHDKHNQKGEELEEIRWNICDGEWIDCDVSEACSVSANDAKFATYYRELIILTDRQFINIFGTGSKDGNAQTIN